MITVSCGTVSTFAPSGTFPLYASSSPGLPVDGSRWSVAVGPAMRCHVVTVFLFLPVPVVLVVFLNSAYWLGVPCFAAAWTRESSW